MNVRAFIVSASRAHGSPSCGYPPSTTGQVAPEQAAGVAASLHFLQACLVSKCSGSGFGATTFGAGAGCSVGR